MGPLGGWGLELWTACDQITLDLSDPRGWRREPFARIAPWPERGREGPDLWRAGRGVGYRHALPEGVATPSCRPWGLGLKEGRTRTRPGRVGAVPGRLRELAPPEVWPRRFPPRRRAGASAAARVAISRPPSAARFPRRKPFNWARERASDRPAGLALPTLPSGPVIFGVRVGKRRRGPARTAQGGEVHSSERGLRQCVRSVANRRGVGQPGHRHWHTGGKTRGRFYTEELTEGWEGLVRPPLARATRRPNHHDWQNAEP